MCSVELGRRHFYQLLPVTLSWVATLSGVSPFHCNNSGAATPANRSTSETLSLVREKMDFVQLNLELILLLQRQPATRKINTTLIRNPERNLPKSL